MVYIAVVGGAYVVQVANAQIVMLLLANQLN